jgi:xanthine/CO dehydrogenase XdhC/CoxF family maturation factor/CTP:molybdopterin cytidylyltransferase MocA
MKETRQIIAAYELAIAEHKKAVLATVVHIEGSAYRGPGARMLITEDGMLTGAISGGCLEGDVLRKAQQVMMEEKPMLITYDTTDEEEDAFGISLGCQGIIRILLEPLPNEKEVTPISLLRKIPGARQPSVIVTFFSPDDQRNAMQGTKVCVMQDAVLIKDEMPFGYQTIAADITHALLNRRSAFIKYPAQNSTNGFTAFIEYIAPVPSLIIAGAGNDVLPLVQFAAVLGWDITLVDGRPAYANTARFPGCRISIAKPGNALQHLTIDEQTVILLMSHNYQYDKAILAEAIKTDARYIGMLGPRKKKTRLLQDLKEEGITLSGSDLARIYAPTGLDIGAETSEEIALAIIAEIKAVFAGRPGTLLRGHNGKIHQRPTRIVSSSLQSYAILLLAAGASKRLGKPKQQLVYNGKTLLQHAAHEALETGTAATVVVVAPEPDNEERLKGLPVDIVVNENAQEGMSGSIRKGIEYISRNYPEVKNVLIMLCDQPYVNVPYLSALIEKQKESRAPVVASYYDGRKGVPALFNQSIFPQLLALQGDTGAKYVIESLGDAVATIAFPGGVTDVDTKEAYQQIIMSNTVSGE